MNRSNLGHDLPSTPASLPAERMKRVCDIIDEYRDELLMSMSSGGNSVEHVKGYMSSLRLAIMEELSDCVVTLPRG
jgi:hypothetical protein